MSDYFIKHTSLALEAYAAVEIIGRMLNYDHTLTDCTNQMSLKQESTTDFVYPLLLFVQILLS